MRKQNVIQRIGQSIIDHQWAKIEAKEEYLHVESIQKDTTESAFIELNIALRALFITVLHKVFFIPERYLEVRE